MCLFSPNMLVDCTRLKKGPDWSSIDLLTGANWLFS